jgi:hypothetical protein
MATNKVILIAEDERTARTSLSELWKTGDIAWFRRKTGRKRSTP